jgi:hypothetical protein
MSSARALQGHYLDKSIPAYAADSQAIVKGGDDKSGQRTNGFLLRNGHRLLISPTSYSPNRRFLFPGWYCRGYRHSSYTSTTFSTTLSSSFDSSFMYTSRLDSFTNTLRLDMNLHELLRLYMTTVRPLRHFLTQLGSCT